MAEHTDLGIKGEEMATEHLVQNGYKVLERNWRFGKEEVDIIATIDEWLVVVEVKTRNSDYFGLPQESVSRTKQAHLIRAAHAYIEKKGLDLEVRFDVIGIILNKQQQELSHVEDAFQPRW